MTSFQAIALSKNTNLAVVAPGIAEALFATALGLLAAIPAVIFYNKFAADSSRLSPAAGGVCRRVLGHRVAPDRRSNLNGLWSRAMGASCETSAGQPAAAAAGATRHTPMHEINVTPIVDVMLVLLIIFMVAAPLLTVGVPIELPRNQGQAAAIQQGAAHHQREADGNVYIRRRRSRSTRSQPSSRRSPRAATTSRFSFAATRASTTAPSCVSWAVSSRRLQQGLAGHGSEDEAGR